MKTLAAAVLWMVASLFCQAEPRWCVVSEKDSTDILVYPPIARAARVQGVVVMRMIYAPSGEVLRTEPIFGPAMLSNSLTSQLSTWTVKSTAVGNEECVTLVIADFRFHNPDEPTQIIPAEPSPPGVLRLSVESEPIVISDPGGVITWNPFSALAYKVRRVAKYIFHRPG